MHPIICQFGPFTVYSYGVSLAAAVMVCAFLLQKDAKKKNDNPQDIVDLLFFVVMGGIVGGRLFYILLNFSFFAENPSEVIQVQHGGLAWQGAFVLGLLSGILFIKKKKWPLFATLDMLAPYIALGQSIGRIGCFLNGCCFGKEAPWGIYFPVHGARLHPTQLYDSLGLLLIFLILKKFQPFKKRDGEVFLLYIILAAGLRFFVEFYRADHSIFFIGLSIFQIISLGFVLSAASVYFLKLKK